MTHPLANFGVALAALGLIACGSHSDPSDASTENSATALPTLVVYKNESCGCCRAWVAHMRRAGFEIKVHNVDNLGPTKERVGIPAAMGSCHTAEVGATLSRVTCPRRT